MRKEVNEPSAMEIARWAARLGIGLDTTTAEKPPEGFADLLAKAWWEMDNHNKYGEVIHGDVTVEDYREDIRLGCGW